MTRKIWMGFAGLAVVLVTLAGLFGDRILLRVMQRQVELNLSEAGFAQYAEGLHVVLCGAGSPMPDPKRAGPCVAVIAGEHIYVVDVGSGAVRNMTHLGLPPGRVEALLLTHFHSDHIDGVGELMLQRWAGGARKTPLPVVGPTGVDEIVQGFNQAYSHDFGYRVAHHGTQVMAPDGGGATAQAFVTPPPGVGEVVIDKGGLKVTAFAVDHAPVSPAVGYRFDYQGRSVVISGDTVKSANLTYFAQGVDVLVHEALDAHLVDVITQAAEAVGSQQMAIISADIHDYHTTPRQAAEVAQSAGARHLLFYHIVPALPLRRLEALFIDGVEEAYDGPVTVGRDGTWLALPPQGNEVIVGRRG